MSEIKNKFYFQNDSLCLVKNFDDNILSRGKSLYEVVRVIESVPLFLDRHLDRLINSAKLVNLSLWLDKSEIKAAIKELIGQNENQDGNVKIIFNYNENSADNKFLAYYIEHHYPSEEEYNVGVEAILYHGERSNPNAKVINNDFRKRVDNKISASGVYEAILVDSDGHVTEGSKSNIFMVRNDTVITAPVESVLPGITRDVIIRICKSNGISFAEEKVYYKDIVKLDGLFISGTSPKVLPIRKVDDIYFNSVENSIVQRVKNLYDEYILKSIKEHK